MEYDVVIVGGGPAGLSAAIRLKQLAAEKGVEIGVCVLEKGSEIGAHILSGAVMDPRAISELFPDWKEQGAPLTVEVIEDRFLFLSEKSAMQTPNWALPDNFKNHGNYVISLGNVTRWLGQQAEALGVEIFPGFPAAEILYNDDGSVKGVATGNMGIGKDGEPTENFQLGMELHAKYTLFAEGCRGHLGRQLISKFKLDANADPQAYGIGIKELWEIDPAKHKPGLVIHTAGWPLKSDTYGGSFLYHMDNNQVVVGFVVGLGYTNPYLSPFEEFQRYKTHPSIRAFLEGGKRVSYGARAITAGGLLSLPKTVFPGGALIGDDAGFLNASRIKGSHAAIKTGMLAADAAFDAVQAGRQSDELNAYPDAFKQSWLYTELYRARNFKQWMAKGLYIGTPMVFIEQKLMGGNVPWTLHHKHADHEMLKPASQCEPIEYPKPDGKLTFDRLSSVFISNTNHEENQPAHLTLKDANVPVNVNLRTYAGPESRFCPAAVYEFVKNDDGSDRLVINAQNCVHCKTCDIKDPTQNIVWVTPEGGGGPNYPNM
ncbi:electron transfer flavoprotein-ubiquinone oxidoreductase [Burkholderia ubonensis]|nr:electron transfer flavoprotein-ubiquinone oxidoreductase [Burkholderia ubonensis]PAJ81919.1 electron transfer flavoprotein-ubiquinone oxidoreductase [Burkholderia ubonensis]PAJ88947.1 electron transfer flavoprotein-ubiquinone oxidoreductase [Burkholderia ubonensis]PAJ93036.1 electron transfer flavoprotein-ubiquinone oxidoreductase [Burkholderia ubonensis]PAK01867.1 electron transfer flavoprotein-ubiquinone oxidoreductase [Burkholderia ubonensis]PAK09511.1 electron transfer flavoprotein-ubiq